MTENRKRAATGIPVYFGGRKEKKNNDRASQLERCVCTGADRNTNRSTKLQRMPYTMGVKSK